MYSKVQVWIARGLLNEEKQFLLFKVIPTRGEGWHPVTGSVEKGEKIKAAARRETQEETGIDTKERKGIWFDLEYSFKFSGQWGDAEEHAFGLWLPESIKKKPLRVHLDPKEHTEAKWVSMKAALKELKFSNQKKALKLFYEKLSSQTSIR